MVGRHETCLLSWVPCCSPDQTGPGSSSECWAASPSTSSTVGLLLVLLLLAMAVTASLRKQAPGAWAAYLCGVCAILLPFAIAVTVVSPLVGGLLVAGCAAALTLGVAGLALRGDLRVRARGR